MALSIDEVRHVATLARLSLTEEEERRFAEQLSAILDAFRQLEAVDVTGVEPTSHAGFAVGALRPDAVEPSLPPEQGLANAPAKAGTSFAVPRVIE
jgi:aspartyl-tRNA(Asn)/glutamyl-tRNA(Gln) amidotransferase subunit C